MSEKNKYELREFLAFPRAARRVAMSEKENKFLQDPEGERCFGILLFIYKILPYSPF